jgi:hypothetical protein
VESTLEMTANSARLSQISACVEAKSGTKAAPDDSAVESLHDHLEKGPGEGQMDRNQNEKVIFASYVSIDEGEKGTEASNRKGGKT